MSVLAGPLRAVIGLTEEEIGELTDYFRVQDGRILYTQLCEVIHASGRFFYMFVKACKTHCIAWDVHCVVELTYGVNSTC